MNVELPIKRTQMPFALFGWILVTVVFILLIVNASHSDPYYNYTPVYYVVSGYAILMSGIAFIDYLKTLFDKNAKLVLSEEALYDNLSIFSLGAIPWKNITGVELIKLKRFNAHFIILKLSNTDTYLASRNFLFRYILKKYLRTYGGIVVISEHRIDYDINQLKSEIIERCSFSI